jgi:hypothetical protein
MWKSEVITRSFFHPATSTWQVRAKYALPIVSYDVVSTSTPEAGTPYFVKRKEK